MIKKWLINHWWVNEIGKTIVVCGFSFFGYSCWEGGKLASAEIGFADIYKIMVFGVGTGIFGMLALFILVDISAVLIAIIMRKSPYDKEKSEV